MKHPTKAQVQIIIKNLKKIQKIADSKKCGVDMSKGTVSAQPKHLCQTPHCHGGWYAISIFNVKQRRDPFFAFTDGATAMARHLGFKSKDELENWIKINPDIWGNINGYFIFSDPSAFGYEESTLTMKGIIKHWEGVQSRLKK